jgi:hypothetical protein
MSLLKPSCLAGLALAVLLSVGRAPAAQEADQNDGFLLGACFKAQALVDKAIADLQKVDRDISADDRMIQKLEDIIAQARQKDNKQAESTGRELLLKARSARRKNEETRAALELRRARAVASLGAIRNKMSSEAGSEPRVRGFVSDFSGRVQVNKKNGETFGLTSADIGLLETGDSLLTYGASSVEFQALDGRGTVKLGEYSELKLEEDTPAQQAVELVRGTLYSAVEKKAEFEAWIADKMDVYRKDLLALPGMGQERLEALEKRLKAWVYRKFQVRRGASCGAVRGTKFSVEATGDETTFAVYEGTVEVGDLEGRKTVLVEAGFKVVVTKDAISEPVKIASVDSWWDK